LQPLGSCDAPHTAAKKSSQLSLAVELWHCHTVLPAVPQPGVPVVAFTHHHPRKLGAQVWLTHALHSFGNPQLRSLSNQPPPINSLSSNGDSRTAGLLIARSGASVSPASVNDTAIDRADMSDLPSLR
jgi:hypothetical protein